MIADKDLAGWWNSIAHDSRFERVVMEAKAQLFDSSLNPDQQNGAAKMVYLLSTIAEGEPKSAPFPTPGLNHKI